MKKVREKLNAKLRKSGGFTLVEMLIVVAIIAILIAVSIPIVNGALEKARQATDAANVRAAAAAATIQYLKDDGKAVTAMQYDASKGKLDNSAAATAYGKADGNEANVVWVKVSADGEVEWAWGTPGTSEPTGLTYTKGQPVTVPTT